MKSREKIGIAKDFLRAGAEIALTVQALGYVPAVPGGILKGAALGLVAYSGCRALRVSNRALHRVGVL